MGGLVESYAKGPDRIPPRQLDAIINKVARDGGGADQLERSLSGWVRGRAVDRATEHVDVSEAGKALDAKFDAFMDEVGLPDLVGRPERKSPEPDPEPFGQRTVVEGEDFRLVQEKYNAGEISGETLDAERAKRGLEKMRA